MMTEKVDATYRRLREMPFPSRGRHIGDFPLYDALLAGIADRYCQGQAVRAKEIPVPDRETVAWVESHRGQEGLTTEEREFLEYFELLESLRKLLEEAAEC